MKNKFEAKEQKGNEKSKPAQERYFTRLRKSINRFVYGTKDARLQMVANKDSSNTGQKSDLKTKSAKPRGDASLARQEQDRVSTLVNELMGEDVMRNMDWWRQPDDLEVESKIAQADRIRKAEKAREEYLRREEIEREKRIDELREEARRNRKVVLDDSPVYGQGHGGRVPPSSEWVPPGHALIEPRSTWRRKRYGR